MSGARWYRDIYRDAVWEDETLSAAEKAVAETYARHARDQNDDKGPTADLAWLTYPRIMTKAGIGRRAKVAKAVGDLVKAGWLTPYREASRRPTVYRLTIPSLGSTVGTTEAVDGSSDGGTSIVPVLDRGSSDVTPSSRPGSSDGGTQPLEDLPKLKQPSSSAGRSPTVAEVCRRAQVDDEDEARRILERAKSKSRLPVRNVGGFVRSISDADWIEIRDEERAEAIKAKPDWCGICDERSRLIHGETSSSYCPRCHPPAVPATQPLTVVERQAIANVAHRTQRRRMPGVGSAYVNNTDPDAYTELIPEDSPEEVARRNAMYTEDPWVAVIPSAPAKPRGNGYKGPYRNDPNCDYDGPF